MARLSRGHSPCSWNAGEQEGVRRLQNSALPDIKGLELRGTQPQLCQHWGSTFCLSALIVFSLFQKHNRGMWYKIKSKLQTTFLWKGSLSLHAPSATSAPHPSPVRRPGSSTAPRVLCVSQSDTANTHSHTLAQHTGTNVHTSLARLPESWHVGGPYGPRGGAGQGRTQGAGRIVTQSSSEPGLAARSAKPDAK